MYKLGSSDLCLVVFCEHIGRNVLSKVQKQIVKNRSL